MSADAAAGGRATEPNATDLAALLEASTELSLFPPDGDLHAFIARTLSRLASDSIVVVCDVGAEDEHVVRGLHGLGPRLEAIAGLLDASPLGMRFPGDVSHVDHPEERMLVEYAGGCAAAMAAKLPRPIAVAAGAMLGLGAMYVIDFIWGGQRFGNASILLRSGRRIDSPEVVKTFVGLASVALQKQAAAREARAQEGRYEGLFEQMPTPAALLDLFEGGRAPEALRFVEVNTAFSALLAREPGTLAGTPAEPVLASEGGVTGRRIAEVLEGGGLVRWEDRIPGLGGELLCAASRPAPGEVLLILEDLTEQRQAEAERARLAEWLHQAQRMESVGLLAGGIAHDFNNLLSPILGYTELALSAVGDDESLREDLGEVLEAGKRAQELTRRLLAFGRKEVLDLKVVDVAAVASRLGRVLSRTLREDIDFRITAEASGATVLADRSRLEQVLMNLVVNAQDALRGPGSIHVEVGHCEVRAGDPRPEVEPGSWAFIRVTDDGPGMDAATAARVFEPFFTTKEVGRGTGLGLATVYGIVAQHGGHVWVETSPGRGASFVVLLPPSSEGPESQLEPSPASARDVAGVTVLVVEDAPPVLRLAARVLRSAGFEVHPYGDPREALAAVATRSVSPHLLLTDVIMPGMNGKQLGERLADLVPGLGIVYMSGHPDDVISRHDLLDRGAALLRKPFTAAALVAALHAALAERSRSGP